MNPSQQSQDREQTLSELAAQIRRQQLAGVACMILEAVEPVAMIASQVAIFAQPFAPSRGWQRYLGALGDEQSWRSLRRMVDQPEC